MQAYINNALAGHLFIKSAVGSQELLEIYMLKKKKKREENSSLFLSFIFAGKRQVVRIGTGSCFSNMNSGSPNF